MWRLFNHNILGQVLFKIGLNINNFHLYEENVWLGLKAVENVSNCHLLNSLL